METNFTYKTTFLSSPCKLTFTSDALIVEKKNNTQIIKKTEITDFHFDIRWFSGLDVIPIGRHLEIDIIIRNMKLVKVRMTIIYGIRRKLLLEKYSQIIDALYEFYFNEKIQTLFESIQKNQPVTIGEITITGDGIYINTNYSAELIQFSNLNFRSYYKFIYLSSTQNLKNNIALYFRNDPGAVILYSLLSMIFREKELQAQ